MRRAATRVIVVALASALTLTGCTGTPLDNVIEGLVGEGAEQLQGGVEGLVEDALGGTAITSDGQLPEGFPADAVPVTGTVLGGGSGPNGTGWVARTELASAAEFEQAKAALEGAGFTASAVNSDANSGFGTFTSADHTVVLVVATESGQATATYVVTPS
ncbi:hypothetical protein ACFFGH_30885 [Lysobacter korlensis]|uniref:PASTA domain-containing protein n=1 Tax=Lysobacter korlensis TaxID=553636 RepID=A0ABV6S0N0_9GAMM